MNSQPFDSEIYRVRRSELSRLTGHRGLILFIGNVDAPINYPANHYWFRQDSSFSYFFGLNQPGLAAIIDQDDGSEIVFGTEPSADEMIWIAPGPSLAEQAARAGVGLCLPYAQLDRRIADALAAQRRVHYLPAYRAETTIELSRILGCPADEVAQGASRALSLATIALRQTKDAHEIAEIEAALAVTDEVHRAAMRATRPGVRECEVVARLEAIMRAHDLHPAYPAIFTRRGEILHNLRYDNKLEAGDLVVNDCGVSSPHGYASDVTRTLPVGGRFEPRQRALYEIVLGAQREAIERIAPAVPYREVHLLAALRLVEGLVALGLFNGDPREIVATGAYALCFPHGLGHQLGLDVHDMESIGEDLVGYAPDSPRSTLFGLKNLRLDKKLQAGMVLTVEPGVYFIPQLIESWRSQGRHAGLINYSEFAKYIGFGGIRIEDDVLVTEIGCRILGPPIPKTCLEIEAAMRDRGG